MTGKLGKFLLEGKFCLLYGHRQSGKSTTAFAVKGWLEENSDKEIYIVTFSSGIVTDKGLDKFWQSVCSKMASLDARKFKFNNNDTASSSTFEGFFSKYNYPSAKDCIIIIDEASCLGNCDGSSNSQVISSFISSLRNLKDGRGASYNVYSFLLVGTDVIRDFLIQHQRPDSEDPGSNISPFSDEASLTSARFTPREIEQLLEQFSSENNYKLDICIIAFDIYSITLGHKGLVGLCCFYLADRVMAERRELKFDDWRRETYNLPGFIRGKATYERIIQALHGLSFAQKKILMKVIRFGYDVVSMDNSDAKFLLGEGMVIIHKILQDGEEAIIRCAAPILRTVMITQLSEVKIDLNRSPAQDRSKNVDGKWLLERTIENLSIQHIFTDKTTNKTGRPSEYAWQAEFITVLKNLLPKAYPHYFFRVLPEVRELEDDNNHRQRLDILLSDGEFIESYGYELIEASRPEFDDHYERSKKYTDLHGCYMYMVNLCTDRKLVGYFGSGYENVAVVHVVYNLKEGCANLIYEESKVTVPILSIPYFKPYE